MPNLLRKFIQLESAGGIILLTMAVLALIADNLEPFNYYYEAFLRFPLSIQLGNYVLSKTLLHWLNDGLMTICFLLVGLEIKREVSIGELNSPKKAALPAIAALGGMLMPALIYTVFNLSSPIALRGWAIPTATDIAFSLGVLSLLGSRVPLSLKVFLTAMAIFDDLGAVIVIALFYTSELSISLLLFAFLCVAILTLMNRLGVESLVAYFVIGLVLWFCVLQSGVHATLAGVILAMMIPVQSQKDPNYSPLLGVEKALHPWVAYFILPAFSFCNAGVSFHGIQVEEIFSPIMLGIFCALFFGKQLGVFLATFLAVQLGLAQMPRAATWLGLYGISIICGVGFTMSFFVGSLAFDSSLGVHYPMWVRSGVLLGSLASGVVGDLFLRFVYEPKN